MSDLKGIEISDVLGLSQPLTKLIETVFSGIGKVYEPVHVKRMAVAKADEIKSITETIRDNSDLPVNYQYGNILIDTSDSEALMQRTQNRLLYQEAKRQENIESVVGLAYEELKNEEVVDTKPVNPDWITRFFNIVGDVSDEEMKIIWAKILAGEIKQSGRFSLRFIETVRNLSTEEAGLFCEFIPYLIPNGEATFLPSSSDLLKKYGIGFNEVCLLEECGLIKAKGLFLTKEGEENIFDFMYDKTLIEIIMVKKNEKYSLTTWPAKIGGYFLTSVGYELLQLSEKRYHEKEYLVDFVTAVKKDTYGYDVKAKILSNAPDGTVEILNFDD